MDKPLLCRPCCFNGIPEGYDVSNDNGMQEIKTQHKKCNINSSGLDAKFIDIDNPLACKNEKYIENESSVLKHCRLGLLPTNLDILLNNNQDIFLSNDRTSINEYTNCFLRRGVIRKPNGNFLYCLGAIKGIYNITKLKEFIINSITPELFITLNKGDLVKIYSSNELLPYSYELQTSNFIQFIKENPYIYRIFNINDTDIKNYNKIDSKTSKKYLLIGDMLELGSHSKKLHKSIAPIINQTKIDKVFVKGKMASIIFESISKAKKGRILLNKSQIIELIRKDLNNNDYLMIKASLATGFNDIVKDLKGLH